MKRVFTIAPLLLILFGCAPSPKSLVESHLQLIKDGKQAEANAQYCIPKETLKLHTVTAFKVSELVPDKKESSSVLVVFPEIDTPQFKFKTNAEGQLTAEKEKITVKIQVWKSEEFYQAYVKSRSEINNLIRSSSAITGSAPKILPIPTREDVNSADKCLYVEAEGVVN